MVCRTVSWNVKYVWFVVTGILLWANWRILEPITGAKGARRDQKGASAFTWRAAAESLPPPSLHTTAPTGQQQLHIIQTTWVYIAAAAAFVPVQYSSLWSDLKVECMYYSLGLGQGQFFLELTRLSGCQYRKALTKSNVFKLEIFHPNDVGNIRGKTPSVKTRFFLCSLLSCTLRVIFLISLYFFQIIVFVWWPLLSINYRALYTYTLRI